MNEGEKAQREQKVIDKNRVVLTGEEIEVLYGIDAGTLANYRSRKEGCKYYKLNRKAIYRKTEFEEWLFGKPVLTHDSLPDR